MNLNFKNRIAFYYMVATATIMAIVFGAIFFTVNETVWQNLDSDLSYEAKKHTRGIEIVGDSIKFANKAEWEEREHRESQVNPVFIQVMDRQGRLMDKSPNLKLDRLPFNASTFGGHFDAKLNERNIRQVQLPIESEGEIKGYILSAMSSESAFSIISRLRNVLFASYVIVLIGLSFVSRFLAGRSIIPIQEMTQTITRITKNNLKERVNLPQHRDEMHDLSTNFNALLERIEKAIEREKQFTSDASHELRTPLATLRGTLEVLIRKPRTQAEYEAKVRYSLGEIARMTTTLEQLLLLARLDSATNKKHDERMALPALIDESISSFKHQISEKRLKIKLDLDPLGKALVPHYYSKIIIENVLSNAIKYSEDESSISIDLKREGSGLACTIKDEGVGIKQEDLARIYDSFFRSDALGHKHISGTGLGLAIAKKCADAIRAELAITSRLGEGTTVTITFLSQS